MGVLAEQTLHDRNRGVVLLRDAQDDLESGIPLQERRLEVLVQVAVESAQRTEDRDARYLLWRARFEGRGDLRGSVARPSAWVSPGGRGGTDAMWNPRKPKNQMSRYHTSPTQLHAVSRAPRGAGRTRARPRSWRASSVSETCRLFVSAARMASRSVSPAQQPEEARTPGTPEESPAVEKQTPAEELLPFHDVGLPATKIWVHPNCPEPDVLKADIVAWGGVVTEKMRGAHYALFRNLFEDRDDVEQARRDCQSLRNLIIQLSTKRLADAEPVLSSWIKEVFRSFEKWRDDPALSSVPFVRKFFENDIKAVDDKPRKGRVNITHQEKQRIIYEVSRFKNPNELTPQGGKNYKVWDELERWVSPAALLGLPD